MQKYNISFLKTADLSALLNALAEHGTISFVQEKTRIIGMETEPSQIATITALSGVVMVEEDTSLHITPHTDVPWHLQRITTRGLPLKNRYPVLNTGAGCVVYLVDSGVDATHSELATSSIINLYTQTPGDFTDSSGHGTAMASLIVGQTVGVSPAATLKNVKMLMNQNMTISDLLAAFDAILVDHAATPGAKIVNCSWTIPKSAMLDSKLAELQSENIVVVAAAGNQGQAANNFSPAGLDSIIGVGCSDAYDRVISWGKTLSNNWGPEVDICAPGIGVSVANLGTRGLEEQSGTSVACSIVSGIVCQLIAQDSALTANQAQSELLGLAIDDLLFRNETIYGTTPNKLAQTQYMQNANVWAPSIGTLFYAKRGEATPISLALASSVDTATYSDATLPGGNEVVAFTWAVSTQLGAQQTLVVTPPNDLPVGKYTLFLRATSASGLSFTGRFIIGVYVNDPSELDIVELENYQTIDNGQTVIKLSPQYCGSYISCPKSAPGCCSSTCSPYSC